MQKYLLDACNITTGKLDSNAATKNGKYPFFTCAPEPLKINEFAFDDDVILLAGNNAQGNFHLMRYKGKFNAYQRTYIITAREGFDIDYIKYSIELSLNHLKKVAQGSQTKFLTMQILEQFRLKNISLENQKKQVACLVALDKKISLNKKINATLEDMAKTLYDYFFVQFDFPDENGKPYKTSGGKMIFSSELGREIPLGWEVGNLNKIADYVNGLACQNFRPKDDENFLPVVKIREIHDGINFDTEKVTANIPEKNIIYDGDILFSWSATLEVNYWIGGKAGLNQHIFKVFPKKNFCKEFVYHQLREYVIHFAKIAESRKTTMGHITQDHLNLSRIILPPKKILAEFEKNIRPIHAKIIQQRQENNFLERLRDFLLPMLMNRQVGFKED